jgi:hypothetical protein
LGIAAELQVVGCRVAGTGRSCKQRHPTPG